MTQVAGELVTESLPYDGGREVTAYVPPQPADAVVFAADGGWHTTRLAESLERAGVASTMVVGVHGMDDDEGRFREYVSSVDPERFAAHEAFVLDQVVEWVEARLGVELRSDRTAVWGASLGGELALAMGMSHPDVFGAVFCASPGGGYRPPDSLPRRLPAIYLVAGDKEEFFVENAKRWADALRGTDARCTMTVREGDHGDAFWYTELPLMVRWAFTD